MYYLYVALFGGLGAVARYWLSNALEAGLFPYNTLLINLIGCFLFAVIFRYLATFPMVSETFIIGIGTGFVGSFTTFSAFSLQTVHLFLDKHYTLGGLYIGASFIGGILSAGFGVLVSNRLIARKES